MSTDKATSQMGGFLVLVPRRGESGRLVGHHPTEGEAADAARAFAAQADGHEAFVIPAVGDFYRARRTRPG